MLLSDLVKLKLELKQYTNLDQVKAAATVVDNNVKALRSTASGIEYDKHITDITKVLWRDLNKLNKEVQAKVNQITESIDTQIQEQTSKYFEKSYATIPATVEQDRTSSNRQLKLPPDLYNMLLGRIQLYADWHYPGMEIGPHDGEFTPHLVGCDPLYLVDVHYEYLESTRSKFAEEYQARLRSYCIGHGSNEKGLSELPKNQFGFIFSWNVFNYLPFEEIKRYLIDIQSVLRPGGTFMFSFNDGETYNGVRHVEWGSMTYVPKSLLIALIESIGLKVTNSFGVETEWHNISWLEIKKPGTLSTIKAHQTLGIIKDIEQ